MLSKLGAAVLGLNVLSSTMRKVWEKIKKVNKRLKQLNTKEFSSITTTIQDVRTELEIL